MNAKFGKGAYTLSLHFQTGMFGHKTLTIHWCAVCVVYSSYVVSMSKLKNPTREGAGHGDNITQQQLQFTAPGQQVHWTNTEAQNPG